MPEINIDSAIFLCFLIANLMFGLFVSRGVSNIKEYAIGDKKFNTATISFAVISIWVSGEFFFSIVSESYKDGLIFISILVANFLAYFFVGTFFAPRMGEFIGKLSIAEAMGELYNNRVRAITSISGAIGVVGIIGIQLQISGQLFEYITNINSFYGVIISGMIITIYSTLGGVKSVTLTDLIQAATFGVVVPLLSYFLLKDFGSLEFAFSKLSLNPNFNFSSSFSFENPKAYYYISLFLWLLIPHFNPAIFQRISMCRNTTQIRDSFVIASFSGLILAAFICWIGILILLKNPNLKNDQILSYTILEYPWLPGIKGLMAAGIMAMIMSTVDSHVNSNSILLVHDLTQSFKLNLKNSELQYTRLCSLAIGIASIIFALSGGHFFELIIFASLFYMPIVTVPFIMSVLGFRSSSNSVLAGMISGFIVAMFWELFIKEKAAGVGGLIPGMLSNLFALFFYHYAFKQEGGWVGIKNPEPLNKIRKERRLRFKQICYNIKNFDLLVFFRKNIPNNEKFVALLGLFTLFSAFFNINTLSNEALATFNVPLSFLYPVTLIAASLLIGYPLYIQKLDQLENIVAVFWNLMIFFVLICSSFTMVLISNFGEVQIMVFMANILMVSTMINWRHSLFYICFGIALSMFLYEHYMYLSGLHTTMSSLQVKTAYMLFLVVSVLVTFLRPREEYLRQKEAEVNFLDEKIDHLEFHAEMRKKELSKAFELKNEFMRNLQHESHTPITGITSMGEVLYECYDKMSDEERKAQLKNIAQSATRLNSYVNNMIDLSKLMSMNYDLQKKSTDLGKFIENRINLCRKLYSGKDESDKREFILNLADDIIVFVDQYYMSQAIDNLIINAIQYCPEGIITIDLSSNDDSIKISISDEGIGIPEGELFNIFGAFTVSSKTKTPAGGRGIGLALCKKIIELHGGSVFAKHNQPKGAIFICTIPIKNLRQ